MTNPINKGLVWTPRILSMVFIAFLFLMSFDVFEEGSGFWPTAGAFVMHSLPALVLLAILLIAWKREIVGAIGFILAGLAYVVLVFWNDFEWYKLAWAAQISGLSWLTGTLFLIVWRKKKRLTDTDIKTPVV